MPGRPQLRIASRDTRDPVSRPAQMTTQLLVFPFGPTGQRSASRQDRATSMPDAALVRIPGPAKARPAVTTPCGFDIIPTLSTRRRWFPCSPLLASHLTWFSRPFPSVLTTMAFDHSHRRRFGTRSCKPVPRGLPSSIKQLHTLGPPRPFALVAHHRRRSVR